MDDQAEKSLHDRIAALERSVRNIEHALDCLTSQSTPIKPPTIPELKVPKNIPIDLVNKIPQADSEAPPSPPPPITATRPSRRKSFSIPKNMQTSEYWLNKVGISLLLIAVILLFKYSIDKGWLTPPIRIAFGLALGSALLVIGQRVLNKKRHFGQVFLGGSVATYYITGFAAFQLFSLVSHSVAMVFMIAVTVLSFAISLRQDKAIFSIIGVIGGLSTPFLLYTGSGNVPGLIMYTCFILAGTSAVYFYRGWYTLLWLSIIGGWQIYIIGIDNSNTTITSGYTDQWAVQTGVLAGWLFFWAVPILRDVVCAFYPDKLRLGQMGFGDESMTDQFRSFFSHHPIVLTIIVPYVTLGLSAMIWPDSSQVTWGWISLVGSLIYFCVSILLKKSQQLYKLSLTHLMVSLLFLTIALSLLLKGDTLFISLVVEAAILLVISKQISQKGIAIFAHILFGICALVMMERLKINNIESLFKPIDDTPIFNTRALTDLGAISLGFLMSVLLKSIYEKRTYLIASFTTLGLFLCRELEGNTLFISVLVLTLIMHIIAYAKKDRVITASAHIFFTGITIWLVMRMFVPEEAEPVLIGTYALSNLISIIAIAGISRLFITKRESLSYLVCAHLAFLGWFLSELIRLENGQGYVTIAWGIYSTALLIIGLVKNRSFLRSMAVLTLFVVVGKLFLIDLAKLEVLWRILLFMGFGGLFLFLSYYFQDLWRKNTSVEKEKAS